MDLLSLDLSLRLVEGQSLEERPLPRWWGEAAHRLAVATIGGGDAALAAKLEGGAGLKPFTTSSLRGPFPAHRLDPQADYKLRLTALDRPVAEIFAAARESGMLRDGAEVELDFVRFRVQGEAGPREQAGYQSLVNRLFSSQPPPRKLTLQFFSPTLFRTEGRQFNFPLPDLVFGSLMEHWNASESIPSALPLEARKYARECLRAGRFDLRSRTLKLYNEVFTGFVGRVTFHSWNYDRYWMGMMDMLAQYAAFAGVGTKTTMGLGQARFLAQPAEPADPPAA